MGRRDLGIAVLTGRHQGVGAQYEGSLFTPSHVMAEMKTIDEATTLMVRDLNEDQTIPQNTKKAFAQFVAEWRKFYRDNKGWVNRALNTTYALVQEYRDRLSDWQKKLSSMGLNISAPALRATRRSKIPRWVGPAVAVALGLGITMWLFKRE